MIKREKLVELFQIIQKNVEQDRERLQEIVEDILGKIDAEDLNYISAGKTLISSLEGMQKGNKTLIDLLNSVKDSSLVEKMIEDEDNDSFEDLDFSEGDKVIKWGEKNVKQ